MFFDDTYKTVTSISSAIFRDKGSKFIGYVYPLKSESEVKDIINQLKHEHAKAQHFCWALRLTTDRGVFKLNDDGEPSGTAGRPILNSLLSAELTNIIVVVVRYFGGTLLGVPGLINAYKSATLLAIEANEVVSKTVNDVYRICFNYTAMNAVMRVLKDEQLELLSQQFDNECLIVVEIRKARLNAILAKLAHIESVIAKYLNTNS